MSVQHKTGEYVTIGEFLAGTEEFLGDPQTTFTENEKILAASAGFIQIDPKTRIIKVENKSDAKRIIPKKGDMVICSARVVRSHSVGCTIWKINKKLLFNGIEAQLHVSSISRKYIDKITDAFQKTDIIRAQIVGFDGIEWRITTTAINTGVISAQCKYCGTTMTRKNRDQVQCSFCGNVERRVLAPDYGMTTELIDF